MRRPSNSAADIFRDMLGRLEALPTSGSPLLLERDDDFIESLELERLRPSPKTIADVARAFAAEYDGYDDGYGDRAQMRDPDTYTRSALEGFLIREYQRRWGFDRVATGLVMVSGAILSIIVLVSSVVLSTRWLLGALMLTMDAAIGFQIAQSARIGYLLKRNFNHVDDLVASCSGAIIRGHHRVHEVEEALVHRARWRKHDLLVVDVWTGKRPEIYSREFDTVERELYAYSQAFPGKVQTAMAAAVRNWKPCREVLIKRLEALSPMETADGPSAASQRFYAGSPLQCDALLTRHEAILTFPRGNSNRGFALHVRNRAAARELWDIFHDQLSAAEQVAVNSDEDIEQAEKLVLRAGQLGLIDTRGEWNAAITAERDVNSSLGYTDQPSG